jgi:Serine/threonine protein kinase
MEAPATPAEEAPVFDHSPYAAGFLEQQSVRGYTLRSCIASTDRTAVFKADDQNLDRTVAVKVMRPWPGREGVVEDFFSLAGSVARLRSPAILRGLDAGRADGSFFMAHEYVNGETLAGRLARRQTGRFTEKESLKLAGLLAGLLRDLFEQGHPHGNLTPANVMLVDGGRGKLADIGFAWTLAWPDDASAFGTKPWYLPPERIEGDLNVDIRGDLYSLGCIWHKALLGEDVFTGATPEEVLEKHRGERPASPRDRDPRLSSTTGKLLLWLLEKDRDARPRTPRDFLRKLALHPLLAEDAPVPERGGGEADATDESAGGTNNGPNHEPMATDDNQEG